MPTFTDDYAALRAVETRLATLFATGGAYALKYAGYGGVDVKLKTDEDEEPENVGRPMILLEQQSSPDVSELSAASDDFADIALQAMTLVSDSSGAQQGTANPVTSDELLSKDLVFEIRDNYSDWRDLGLYNIRISPGQLVKGKDETVRRISHRITASYKRG